MKPFEFINSTPAKLASVNIRSEKHGPELVPALDLKIVIEASNDILDKLHPDLKASLYFQAVKSEGDQQDLDGVAPATNLPNLKFPKLGGPLKWEHAGAGYTLELDYGLGGDSNLVLDACDVNNFALDTKEGGTVELAFRAQVSGVDERILGKLAGLVQHSISIILTAPTLEAVGDVIKQMESPFLNSNPGPLTPEQALIGSVEPQEA